MAEVTLLAAFGWALLLPAVLAFVAGQSGPAVALAAVALAFFLLDFFARPTPEQRDARRRNR